MCKTYKKTTTTTKISRFYIYIGGEASLWDITMNPSTQGPTLEQLQKVRVMHFGAGAQNGLRLYTMLLI